jgi:hypothetical protein
MAAGDKALPVVSQTGHRSCGARSPSTYPYFELPRFLRAALAPSLLRAERVFLGRCATVLFRRAVLAACLMFRLAAARCFPVVIFFHSVISSLRKAGLVSTC